MIVGSGLLARGFAAQYQRRSDVCIYAAGVSNSNGTDMYEFSRERARLVLALQAADDIGVFVYFGTCSVADPEVRHTQYVQHKLAMEQLVAEHPHHLILRLPQVAGHTPNPHTLLNFLYARISRSEAFSVWCNAYRNIIDVDDVATLAGLLIENQAMRRRTLNLANPCSYSMLEIVRAMEHVIGKPAVSDLVERGGKYTIDTTIMLSVLTQTQIHFDEHYLNRVLKKYYGKD
jgi:nucleoside-diphosphate-sugar epimerase